MQSNWSILTVILHISKELWSSLRVLSHSVQMTSRPVPTQALHQLPIHLSWASDQRLPLSRLHESHTLFLYFLWEVLMVTSSMSKQVAQSPEADSISELTTFSPDMSELDEVPLWLVLLSLTWSQVLLEAFPTVPSSGSTVALVGLEGGLVGSCPCGLELGLTLNATVGVSSSPCVELCSLLALTSWESTYVLLSQWSPSNPLGEWGNAPCKWASHQGSANKGDIQ